MDVSEDRTRMVDRQLASRGITDARVLTAFRSVPREDFVPEGLAEFAYEDTPLPIGSGQTISQPYIVAVTIHALGLRGNERVLEIGTGSGYAAAVLSRLAKEVFTVERLESLAKEAGERLARPEYHNVQILCGDGTLGWPEHAPYDAIAVAAGGPEVPKDTERLSRYFYASLPLQFDEFIWFDETQADQPSKSSARNYATEKRKIRYS